jgi:hypothetical protein
MSKYRYINFCFLRVFIYNCRWYVKSNLYASFVRVLLTYTGYRIMELSARDYTLPRNSHTLLLGKKRNKLFIGQM